MKKALETLVGGIILIIFIIFVTSILSYCSSSSNNTSSDRDSQISAPGTASEESINLQILQRDYRSLRSQYSELYRGDQTTRAAVENLDRFKSSLESWMTRASSTNISGCISRSESRSDGLDGFLFNERTNELYQNPLNIYVVHNAQRTRVFSDDIYCFNGRSVEAKCDTHYRNFADLTSSSIVVGYYIPPDQAYILRPRNPDVFSAHLSCRITINANSLERRQPR